MLRVLAAAGDVLQARMQAGVHLLVQIVVLIDQLLLLLGELVVRVIALLVQIVLLDLLVQSVSGGQALVVVQTAVY